MYGNLFFLSPICIEKTYNPFAAFKMLLLIALMLTTIERFNVMQGTFRGLELFVLYRGMAPLNSNVRLTYVFSIKRHTVAYPFASVGFSPPK